MKQLLILIFISCSIVGNANDETKGKVLNVVDGNTLEIELEDNSVYKIILIGVDSPELEQAYGDKAKQFLEKLALKKEVVVHFQGKDRKGNRLAIVLLNEDDIRIDLLKEGLAWTAEKDPSPELEPYKTWAQKKEKGLWKQKDPIPPWIYRRQQSMMQAKSS